MSARAEGLHWPDGGPQGPWVQREPWSALTTPPPSSNLCGSSKAAPSQQVSAAHAWPRKEGADGILAPGWGGGAHAPPRPGTQRSTSGRQFVSEHRHLQIPSPFPKPGCVLPPGTGLPGDCPWHSWAGASRHITSTDHRVTKKNQGPRLCGRKPTAILRTARGGAGDGPVPTTASAAKLQRAKL